MNTSDARKFLFDANVGDTESGPKSDTLGEASTGIRTDHYLDFRHEGKGKESGVRQF
jgi:hypothetical protein